MTRGGTLPIGEIADLMLDARYRKAAPRLAAGLKQAASEAITVLTIPTARGRRLRATNGLERLNKEIERHPRVATLVLKRAASLPRLASAVFAEIGDDWVSERACLNMEAR